LVGDATAGELDPVTPYLRALAVCCRRAGGHVLILPVGAVQCLSDATAAITPDAVVIAGAHAGDRQVAQWAYAVHSRVAGVPFALYQRGLDPRLAGSRRVLMPSPPTEACRAVFELVTRTAAHVCTDA
jgi:hypothetical protein